MSRIAVVIPCFNMGRTLREALDSVLRQTRPPSEVVVVDDGSDDLYTRQALEQLEGPGVVVIGTPHRGVAAARNLGAARTTAEYLVFLDADDRFEPTYLQKAAGLLDGDPSLDIVWCSERNMDRPEEIWRPDTSIVGVVAEFRGHISAVCRRYVWETVGGFDELLESLEDRNFWVAALARGYRATLIDEPLLDQRMRRGSRSEHTLDRKTFQTSAAVALFRHEHALAPHWREILTAAERFASGQRAHHAQLLDRRTALEQQVALVEAQLHETVRALDVLGRPQVSFGDLRRVVPISHVWGTDRGQPVDRYYIEAFLARHRDDIKGRVLEVHDPGYTTMFGGGKVERRDVLDIDSANRDATIVADLTDARGIPAATYDCFILTQTLSQIYDVRAAVSNALRILKPGGVLLCTDSALNRVSYEDRGIDGDYWRFTEASMRALFAEVLPLHGFEVRTYGNVLSCAAFLYGLAAHELTPEELDVNDLWFPLVCAVRAVKPVEPRVAVPLGRPPAAAARPDGPAGAILCWHRIADHDPDSHGLCVSPSELREHLAHLLEHYEVLPVEDLVVRHRAGQLTRPAVALTFDDGYLDHLTVASEALVDLGLPATFFVTTEGLAGPFEYWWDVVERVFDQGAGLPRRLEIVVRGRSLQLPTASIEECRAAQSTIADLMCELSPQERDRALGWLREWSGIDLTPRDSHRALTGDEIRRLAARPGVTIGSHTVRHLVLPSHAAEVQVRELVESRVDLERIVGRRVGLMAYPYGAVNAEVARRARSAGFTLAVTVEPRRLGTADDPLLLPRLEVPRIDAGGFSAWLSGVFDTPANEGRDPAPAG